MTNIITLDALAFSRAFRAAQLLTTNDEGSALDGVYVEAFRGQGARLVASNRYALVVLAAPGLLMPKRVAAELEHHDDQDGDQ